MAFKFPTSFGTQITDPVIPNLPEDTRTPKEKCEAKGGFWDEKRQTCLLAKPKEKEVKKEEAPKVKLTTPETFRDEQGRLSGIRLPNGETYLGLNPQDVRQMAAAEELKTAQPIGTAPVGTAQQQAEEQFKLQQQIGQIGQVGQLTPAQQAEINWSQAATAGASKVIPGLLGGAATGAVAGSVVPGIGTAVGAIGGAIAGAVGTFASGILGNIKEQQRGELQAADIELTNARTNMRQLAMLASQDPANADVYIKQYNDQLTRIHQARRQTQAEVQGDLNAFMEDGREQLADFDAFLQPGGIADVYGQKLKIALQTDTPLSFEGTELMNLE